MPIGRPRPHAALLDKVIGKELDRRRPITSPTSFISDSARPDPTKNKRRVIFVRQADGTYRGQYSDGVNWQTFLATSVSFTTPAIGYGTSYSAGTASTTIRSDATLKFPASLMSSLSSSTLALTDDASNQTLTGSLGIIKLVSASNQVQLDYWTGAGGSTPIVGTVLSFNANTGVVPNTLRNGLDATLTIQDASTYTGAAFIAVRGQVSSGLVAGQTFTTCTAQAGVFRIPSVTYSAGTHSFTEKSALDLVITPGLQSGAGTITVTDCYGLRISGWPTVGTGGATTNARSQRVLFPTVGNTIRRGISLETGTQNLGTEATNTEGFYCEDLTRGTTQRASFYGEGHTTGTPTRAITFEAPAHAVGTDRWSLRGGNKIENTVTDMIASAQSMGFVGQYSDQAGRYFRLRALYNGGAPALTIDDVGTALPTA